MYMGCVLYYYKHSTSVKNIVYLYGLTSITMCPRSTTMCPELAMGSLSDSSKKIQVKNGVHPPVVDQPSLIIHLIA